MPNVEKILQKMKQQPNGVRPEEAKPLKKAYIVDILNRIGK